MTQIICLASRDLCVAVPTQPLRAHLGRTADIRNDQDCETSLLCKYLSMHYLFLLTFYCLLAQCTTLCFILFTGAAFSLLLLAQLLAVIWGFLVFFPEIRLHFSRKSITDIRKFRCVCFWKYQSTLDWVIAQLKRNEQKDAIHQAVIN